jgi:hypothetical protein
VQAGDATGLHRRELLFGSLLATVLIANPTAAVACSFGRSEPWTLRYWRTNWQTWTGERVTQPKRERACLDRFLALLNARRFGDLGSMFTERTNAWINETDTTQVERFDAPEWFSKLLGGRKAVVQLNDLTRVRRNVYAASLWMIDRSKARGTIGPSCMELGVWTYFSTVLIVLDGGWEGEDPFRIRTLALLNI